MPQKAAVYLRISLDQTGEEKAVARQREDALALIKKNKWVLHEVFQDNSKSSKRTVKRPEYNRLVDDYKAGLFSVIVSYDLDRFTREPRQLEDWIEASETSGLTIITLNGEADLRTDAGRLFARMKVAVARSEVERMGARRRRANEQTASEGRPTPGRRPFGWELGGVKLVPAEAKVVRVAYLYLLHGGSLHKLARYWNARTTKARRISNLYLLYGGSPQKLTAHWHAKGLPTTPLTPWTAFKIRQLVDRPRNMGALMRLGVEQPKSLIEPLVSAKTFAAVQAIIGARAQRGRKPEKHLLSGLATCGVCGAPLGSKRLKSRNAEGRESYYVCSSRINRNLAQDERKHPTIRESILEPAVIDAVATAFLVSPSNLFPERDTADLGALHKAKSQAEQGIQRLIGMAAKGQFSDGEISNQLASLRREVAAAAAALNEAYARSATSRFADIRGDLLSGPQVDLQDAADVHGALVENFRSLDFDAQRRLVVALLEVTVSTGWGLNRVKILHKVATSLNADQRLTPD